MSLTLRSMRPKAVQLWHYAAHRTIVTSCQQKLDEAIEEGWDQYNTLWLQWRLALNVYKSGRDLLSAWKLLEEICREENASYFLTEYISAFNLCMGRVCLEMYYSTREREYLSSSYHYSQRGVETMNYDLYAMFQLPEVLQFFGKVMEHYGAFEAAMEVYNKVLSNYPNYRGYFHVLYRTAVVGKYIAEYSDSAKKESFLEQCCDTLSFLLEALPAGLDDVQVVLLYVLCLESSSSASNRFRAQGVYQSLHAVCSKRTPPLALAGVQTTSLSTASPSGFREWSEAGATWRLLGDYFLSMQEELTARDCFRKYVNVYSGQPPEQQQEAEGEEEEEGEMTVSLLLRMAKNSAAIQNFPDATSFAALALKQNHFHRETRRLLARWSPKHAKHLLREEVAVVVLEQTWRQRWFLPGYKRRYHQIVVQQYEKLLAEDYLNMAVREKLSYFARERYRPQFLFEAECARRIQEKFRSCRIVWRWQQPLRVRHSSRTSDCYRRYLKKKFDRSMRAEILAMASHRFLPKKHVAAQLVDLFALQEKSHAAIWKCFKAFHFRNTLRLRVTNSYKRKLMKAALVIQSLARMLNGKVTVQRLRTLTALQHRSAAKIQKTFRNRYSSLRYTTNLQVAQKKRQAEREMVKINFLIGQVWAKKKAVKRENAAQRRITVAYRTYQRFKNYVRNRHHYARRIQKAFRNHKLSGLVGLTRYLIKNRRLVQFSEATNNALEEMLFDPYQGGKHKRQVGSHMYKSPGFRQNTPPYMQCLAQRIVYCDRSFSSGDCVLLGAVLRNPLCRIVTLVLHFVTAKHTNFEFDLVPAIGMCRSLRSVSVLGGVWPIKTIRQLLHQVEVENPMVQTLRVELAPNSAPGEGGLRGESRSMERSGSWKRDDVTTLSGSVSNLLGNFFNYSVPGIRVLSLHGMGLLDTDVEGLSLGLQVNTSIQKLCLSMNAIEDDGFVAMVRAVGLNKKGGLRSLDVSWNMITLGSRARRTLDQFICPSGGCLVIDATNNRIKEAYTEQQTHVRVVTCVGVGAEPACSTATVSAGVPVQEESAEEREEEDTHTRARKRGQRRKKNSLRPVAGAVPPLSTTLGASKALMNSPLFSQTM